MLTKGSKSFFLVLTALVLISIFVTYEKIIVRRDFIYFTTEDELPNDATFLGL